MCIPGFWQQSHYLVTWCGLQIRCTLPLSLHSIMTSPLERLNSVRNHIQPQNQQLSQQPCLAPILGHNPTGPADIAAERAGASFNVEKMKYFWAGGKEEYEITEIAYQIIQRDPDLTTSHFFDQTRPEAREFTMRQIRRAVEVRNNLKDQRLKTALFRCLATYSESFAMRIYVHDLLFRNALNLFGSPEQLAEWQEDIEKFRVLGCFAMTELGHSSFLRGLETTATYDRENDEFIIHSPTLEATKWWIGLAGQTATHTVAICQTIIDSKPHGINWFIVPLRSPTTGRLLPGVTAGDIGAKYGRAGLDNGWIQFTHARIPRTNLLSRWVNVDRDGNYHPAPNPAVMYATLIPERLSIMAGTWMLVGQAVVIAARYGVVRRQGAKDQKIMDYQSHYVKLMPCVAFMYICNITNRLLTTQWSEMSELAQNDIHSYLRKAGDMHAVSAGIKATITWLGADTLERCRRACGGHAYSSYNAIPGIIGDWGVTTTGGGDNIVLLQQTGRYLIGTLHDVAQGRQAAGSAAYLNDAATVLAQPTCVFDNERDWLNIEAVNGVLTWLVVKRLQATATALAASDAWNDHLLSVTRTSELHCHRHLLDLYVAGIREAPVELHAPLLNMGRLYALYVVEGSLDALLEEEYITPKQARVVRDLYIRLCKETRTDAVPLTDAWAFPDFVLKAPIGRADGDIYSAYMETLRAAPGCFGPPPYFEQQIRPLTDPALNGKNEA
ncbi:hypothetical protein BC936DRAFT_145780 [Jimgerdemannia flammicorona]|uniref:Acyl-coenzyme A oxidase n=1 Tax=Jimgerdemannia flammicorona TaxID=994334 RepID=A0A433D966_9FUNG|nr:hypothetical protein BC936DRAFT_145780 [Jimgerdemannia flammicorona]